MLGWLLLLLLPTQTQMHKDTQAFWGVAASLSVLTPCSQTLTAAHAAAQQKSLWPNSLGVASSQAQNRFHPSYLSHKMQEPELSADSHAAALVLAQKGTPDSRTLQALDPLITLQELHAKLWVSSTGSSDSKQQVCVCGELGLLCRSCHLGRTTPPDQESVCCCQCRPAPSASACQGPSAQQQARVSHGSAGRRQPPLAGLGALHPAQQQRGPSRPRPSSRCRGT